LTRRDDAKEKKKKEKRTSTNQILEQHSRDQNRGIDGHGNHKEHENI